jgi:hypothetical protein
VKSEWGQLGRDALGWLRRTAEREIEELRTELEGTDWKKAGREVVELGQTVGGIATVLAVKSSESLVGAAQEAWRQYGRTEATPEATEAATALETVHGTPEQARELLRDMPEDVMSAGVDELVERWAGAHGATVAGQRLGELEAVLEAALLVAGAHDRRARSVPRHTGRPDAVDAKLVASLTTLRDLVAEAKTRVAGDVPDLRALAATASEGAWRTGEKVVGQVRQWLRSGEDGGSGAIGGTIAKARASLGATLDAVSPGWLKSRYEAAKETMATATQQAETVLVGLDGVETDAKDRDALFARFEAALSTAANALDADANAVSVGFLKEAAGGAAGGRGSELVYLRKTGQLVVLDLEMGGARLAVGASKRPFARSIYGTPDAIASVKSRSGGEVGALIFHVGMDTSDAGDGNAERVRSWHAALGIGFNASLPLVGDQSVYSIRQTELATHTLRVAQQDRIEALITGTPDASKSWTGFVRKTLGMESS